MTFRSGLCGLFFLVAGAASAVTIRVPQDHADIQAGIDAAADGDTVLVAPGIYSGEGNRELDFGGTDLVLLSEAGADSTVIHCRGQGRAFDFDYAESPAAVVDGFTIRNGAANYGGGMSFSLSNPTIRNCVITGNEAVQSGGGVHCRLADPTFVNCTISDNRAGENGGGVQGTLSDAVLVGCTVAGNTSAGDGGGFSWGNSDPVLTDCWIESNGAGGDGGALSLNSSDLVATNCVVVGNAAGGRGGGVYSYYGDSALANCTFSGNSADGGGGGFYAKGTTELGETVFRNSILWGDAPDEIAVDPGSGEEPAVDHCDVQGGWPGVGNIDADPLFVDAAGGDFHLGPGSPCIDAGTAEGAPDTDFEGDARPWGAGYDMGADEATAVGIFEPTPALPPTRTALANAHPNPFNPRTTIPFELAEAQTVHLAIYDARGALVRTLVDGTRPAGAHAVTWDGTNAAGMEMPSAAYIVRLTAGETTEQRRLVLVK